MDDGCSEFQALLTGLAATIKRIITPATMLIVLENSNVGKKVFDGATKKLDDWLEFDGFEPSGKPVSDWSFWKTLIDVTNIHQVFYLPPQ